MNKLLEYQRLDVQKSKIEKELQNSEEKNVMAKMISYVKEASNKSAKFENDAKGYIDEYNKLKSDYEKNQKLVEKLTKLSANSISMEEVDESLVSLNSISSEMFMIERKLNILITKVKELLKNFESAKQTALKARAKHKESKEKYDKKASMLQPKIDELTETLSKMEKDLNKEDFAKYKQLKNDNIFPVFVPLNEKVCSACRMEVPSAKFDKLKNEKYIVCEQCRRLIYKI